ncbi:MAG: GIDE domain-containing protein [Candidatus Omnitrophota bacterium]
MSDDRDVAYALFGFCFGIWSFFGGFKSLRRKRLIENIPTSTIRGLAMGLVELCGEAECLAALKSPLTNNECVLYKYLVEEYRSSGKSGHWAKIASGNSFYSPFWIKDKTGKIAVFPQQAELILPIDYEFSTGLGRMMPDNLVKFMEAGGIGYKSWFGTRRLRFKEWLIRPQETVYVLGTAKNGEPGGNDYKQKLMQRIEEIKISPLQMEEIDLDKDGNISNEEWDSAVAKLEAETLEQTLKNTYRDNPYDVIIGRGDVETAFIISDHSEKDLIRKLRIQSLLGIYGGSALSLLLLAYLIFRIGYLGSN